MNRLPNKVLRASNIINERDELVRVNDIDKWYDEKIGDLEMADDINDYYDNNMVSSDDESNDPRKALGAGNISDEPMGDIPEDLSTKSDKPIHKKRVRIRRIRMEFRRASKFHMMGKKIQNDIIDDIEKGESFVNISEKYHIKYRNLMYWKKKGVFVRPPID